MKGRWTRSSGGPGFVRAEAKGRDWCEIGTGFVHGRDEARPSRGRKRCGGGGSFVQGGGPGFVRAVPAGFDWNETGSRLARVRNKLPDYEPLFTKCGDEELANLCITLINQATYMLRRLIEKQQQQFLLEGGIREQMTRARLNQRNNKPD